MERNTDRTNQRFDRVDIRADHTDIRIGTIDTRMSSMDSKIDTIGSKVDTIDVLSTTIIRYFINSDRQIQPREGTGNGITRFGPLMFKT